MTELSSLIERLKRTGAVLRGANLRVDATTVEEAAAALESLMRERDELKVDVVDGLTREIEKDESAMRLINLNVESLQRNSRLIDRAEKAEAECERLRAQAATAASVGPADGPEHLHTDDCGICALIAEQDARVIAPAAAPKGRAQRRMHNIVAAMQRYVATYHTQPEYLNYSDRTFIHDMLYGIGIAMDAVNYNHADGYRRWQAVLSEYLRADTAPSASASVPNAGESTGENDER